MPRRHEFSVFAGSSHPELGKRVAEILGKPLGKAELKTFSCGENYVKLMESVRDKTVFLLQTCRDQEVNQDYMELFLMSDAAKQAYSSKRVAIVPYLGYSRQDKIHGAREPISAKLMAKLAEASGINHVVTTQLHADQEQGFFDIPVDHIKPHGLFADYFKNKGLRDAVVVSTDAGGVKNVKALSQNLGVSFAILHKERPEHNKSEVTNVVGEVRNKTCIIFDDMIDTAGSVCNAREALVNHGANPDVYLCATHPIFSGPAVERLRGAGFKEVVVSDTLPLGPEKQFEGLTQLSVAPLIAEKMAKIVCMPQAEHK